MKSKKYIPIASMLAVWAIFPGAGSASHSRVDVPEKDKPGAPVAFSLRVLPFVQNTVAIVEYEIIRAPGNFYRLDLVVRRGNHQRDKRLRVPLWERRKHIVSTAAKGRFELAPEFLDEAELWVRCSDPDNTAETSYVIQFKRFVTKPPAKGAESR